MMRYRTLLRGMPLTMMLLITLIAALPRAASSQVNGFRASYENDGSRIEQYFRMWAPPEVEHLRGVVFLWAGSGQDWRERVSWEYNQNAARAMGFALIGTMDNEAGLIKEEVDVAFQRILSEAARISGHPELENAPVALMGFSAGGYKMARSAALASGRVIGMVGHKGAQIVTLSDDGERVPVLFVAGEFDSSFTPEFMRQAFQEWRNQGGLAAYGIDWNVGHADGGNQGWEAGWYWIAESIRLRYPTGELPSVAPGNPVVLHDVALESGWLGDKARFSTNGNPVITDPFLEVSPYADYSDSKSAASWLPSEGAAYMYRALTSTDREARIEPPFQTPLTIESPAAFDTVRVGTELTIEIDMRGYLDPGAVRDVVVRDGADSLGTASFDQTANRWTLGYATDSVGVHALNVVATDTSGNARTSFRTFVVLPKATNTATEAFADARASSFALLPGYPNPFADVATVRIDASRVQSLRIDVYNILGRRVQTIADQTVAPGTHSFDFDARELPNGIYLIKASANGETQVQTLVHNK